VAIFVKLISDLQMPLNNWAADKFDKTNAIFILFPRNGDIMSKESNPQDPDNLALNILITQRTIAQAKGNASHVKALDDLIDGGMRGGVDGVLRAYVEGADYNRPRAVEARAWLEKAFKAHNKAATELVALFQENASGNSRPTRKLRKEFKQVCDRMAPYNQTVLHKYESGSTVRGPKWMVEGELSMDPFMKADAEKICAFWSQTPIQIESGVRALAGVGQSAGPRLTQAIDPTLN
jgi:hypothetical protein